MPADWDNVIQQANARKQSIILTFIYSVSKEAMDALERNTAREVDIDTLPVDEEGEQGLFVSTSSPWGYAE